MKKSVLLITLIDNTLATLRTAGALLVGNSALIYFQVIGHDPASTWKILGFGVTLTIIGAIPLGVILQASLKKE
jgi:hypothetical protein